MCNILVYEYLYQNFKKSILFFNFNNKIKKIINFKFDLLSY